MVDERTGSAFRGVGGRAEEMGNRAASDLEGTIGQVSGALKSAYGKTAESAEAVKDAAVAGGDFLRKFMEENPHTTTAIALGLGLLIGYAAHRPPRRRGWWD